MRTLRLLVLSAAAAIVCVSCAPVTDPKPQADEDSQSKATNPFKNAELISPREAARTGLNARIEDTLQQVKERPLLITNAFWTVFHGILGMGLDTTLLDEDTGKRVNAIDHITKGGEIRGMEFIPKKDKMLDVKLGPTFIGQGHQDQFVAEMIQWGLPPSRKWMANGEEHTFDDFIRYSQARASLTKKQELSWAIIVIGQHRGMDITWTNQYGEKLHFLDLIRYELNEPIDTAACGGTHRLFGLTWCLHLHLERGGKLEGVWKDVSAHLEKYKNMARKFRNPDGSFSTKYVSGPGNSDDVQAKISTSGHVLEWLAFYLPDDELRKPWMEDAVNALCKMILDSRGTAIESGALYHAAHGLHIYQARVFGDLKSGNRAHRIMPLPPPGGTTTVKAH